MLGTLSATVLRPEVGPGLFLEPATSFPSSLPPQPRPAACIRICLRLRLCPCPRAGLNCPAVLYALNERGQSGTRSQANEVMNEGRSMAGRGALGWVLGLGIHPFIAAMRCDATRREAQVST